MRAAPILAALLLAQPAAAQTLREAWFSQFSGCYLRHYDAAHLAKHPVQQVTMMALGPDHTDPASNDGRDLHLRLQFSLRSGGPYSATAYCGEAGQTLACSIEGDGGEFVLEPARNGALRLSLTGWGIGIEGDRDFAELSADRGDDRVFLLPAASACP